MAVVFLEHSQHKADMNLPARRVTVLDVITSGESPKTKDQFGDGQIDFLGVGQTATAQKPLPDKAVILGFADRAIPDSKINILAV